MLFRSAGQTVVSPGSVKEVTACLGSLGGYFFLLPVVPVHLNDLEDEANDGDDQQTQLNGVRVCYHKPAPLPQNGGPKEVPSAPV